MTKRLRAQVVELLRCAADRGSLFAARVGLQKTAHLMAWEAKRAVQREQETLIEIVTGSDEYRWLLLEAAARVEEGSWP